MPEPDRYAPTPEDSPWHRLGGTGRVLALVETFYDVMEAEEPTLARLHPLDAAGRIQRGNRERFALFLVGWLGGPQDYTVTHGHPRLRMRHMGVRVDAAMRDAWLRCMARAMDMHQVHGPVRAFLDERLLDVADMLRNVEG